MALQAAGQYIKVEEDVFQALSDIPDIMETTRRYVEIYWKRRNNRFEKRVFNLYRACLRALHHVMKFFSDSKFRKALEVIGKQGAYKTELTASLGEMRRCAELIKAEGQICQAEESHEGFLSSGRTEVVVNRLLNLLETHPLLQMRPADLRKTLLEPKVGPYDLANVDHAVSDTEETENQRLAIMQQKQEEAKALKEYLFRKLEFDGEMVSRDISTCLQLGYQLSWKGKTRASLMMGDDMLRSLLRESHSSGSLLVNGHEDTASANVIPPLSLVAAELSRLSGDAGADTSAVFVLNFFCDEHSPSPLLPAWQNSAVGMIASLICQLVNLMTKKGLETDLSFLNGKKMGKIERFDLATLAKLFKKLVKQLPAGGMVLCIVDEISVYETEMLQAETEFLLAELVGLASKKAHDQVAFKLLVTCRGRAFGVARHFLEHTLDLPEDVDVDDSAEWKISTFMA
ncbi:hypothetical protein RB213_005008 [Colletotrichum asianum]